jgi:SAM-dependent methyltransferase
MTAEPTDGTLAGNYHNAKDEWSPAYLGGYLNWGYWRDVPDRPEYTPADRVHASAELYRLVLRAAGARPGDVVLEVGCGTGTGAIEMSREFQPAEMHGVDKLESQLTAARQACAQVAANGRGELFFQTATADDLPYPANRFDVVISVEALQHFPEAGGFAREASRVLKPGGRLAVTTFFPSAGAGFGDLTELLWSYRTGFDVATTGGAGGRGLHRDQHELHRRTRVDRPGQVDRGQRLQAPLGPQFHRRVPSWTDRLPLGHGDQAGLSAST